ncbi:MAG: KpsF/GutQ family sugar-phosphate isomerase [Bryobacteraceae bacterium]|nr:KpsF/GutQ family sugar-phosphate isomerase [Bryobacteraceae bacterium]
METSLLQSARRVLLAEAQALEEASSRLNGEFDRALDLLDVQQGKILVTGIGKSGIVAQKIAATFCSLGQPAVFLHPVEALHGDLGLYSPGDPSVVLSRSGNTAELLRLVAQLRSLKSPVIGILGVPGSALGALMDVVLDASVRSEADPLNLAPTASAVVALGLGDALAIGLMERRGFTPEDFARFHPSGQLGRNLRLTVSQVMHPLERVAVAAADDPLRKVVIEMTQRSLGAACVLDADGRLSGLVTDGDVRRALQKHDDIRGVLARDVMTVRPATVSPNASVHEALRIMEDRPSQIAVLPVVDEATGRFAGLVRLHDLYQQNPAAPR